jgi:hypothetical protein
MTMPSRRGLPGKDDDPYAERRARIPLVEALVKAFPEQDVAMSIAHHSGLPLQKIGTDSSSVGKWTAVLECAVFENRIDDLIDVALSRSRDPELIAAAQYYREARGFAGT